MPSVDDILSVQSWPMYRAKRFDQDASDCTMSQLKPKATEAVANQDGQLALV